MDGVTMKLEDHWSWDLSRWLKSTFPIDLDGREAYILGSLEAGPGFSLPDSMAWTGAGLDRRLRDRLELLGLWNGPGFAVVTQSGFSRGTVGEREILVHEFAHWIEWQASPISDELMMWVLLHDWFTIRGVETADRQTESAVIERPPWAGHEAPFIRAAIHASHRAGVYASDCRVAGAVYGLSACPWYEHALGDEPRRLESLPVAEILKTPAPAAFAELWASDTNQPGKDS
jgi:hypothetical protein